MRRDRSAKIVATLGPASANRAAIQALSQAGADVFRLNFSHGTHEEHAARVAAIRAIEREARHPVGILADLQGPKLRIGTFRAGPVHLEAGARFRLDLDSGNPGDATRVALPHPEIFAALSAGTDLLLDDGRLRLRVERCTPTDAETRVVTGGALSERKGVNVPGAVLPLSALTEKDRRDLDFALSLGVDWIGLSFVQRPEDVAELKRLVGDRAGVVAKLEKPAAIAALEEIVAAADAVMVARGDLGVEMPAEQVPSIQKRIVRTCRRLGKPVIVATQMLDSMIHAPTPTRAEASDVATAIYDGADAVMLSAESASGEYPVEAVTMMRKIVVQTETDANYRGSLEAFRTPPQASVPDAIGLAMRDVAGLLHVAATVAYTTSGYTALRLSRERPEAPILGLTPRLEVARRMTLYWGVHPAVTEAVGDVAGMTARACRVATEEGFAGSGETLAIASGVPFGVPGSTNLLHIAQVP
jgi:pyruvate kinase